MLAAYQNRAGRWDMEVDITAMITKKHEEQRVADIAARLAGHQHQHQHQHQQQQTTTNNKQQQTTTNNNNNKQQQQTTNNKQQPQRSRQPY
jgi:uncharacterized membrane protein